MSKQIPFSDFLSKLEEYEHLHSWCAKLIADGRYSIQSVCNNIDSMQLTNLMDSFMKFVILLTQCDPNSLSNVKNSTLIPNEVNVRINTYYLYFSFIFYTRLKIF